MKTPGGASSGGFHLAYWCWAATPKVGYLLLLSIQPFANIVGYYTRHDGNDKR